jgi:hypothetical protein
MSNHETGASPLCEAHEELQIPNGTMLEMKGETVATLRLLEHRIEIADPFHKSEQFTYLIEQYSSTSLDRINFDPELPFEDSALPELFQNGAFEPAHLQAVQNLLVQHADHPCKIKMAIVPAGEYRLVESMPKKTVWSTLGVKDIASFRKEMVHDYLGNPTQDGDEPIDYYISVIGKYLCVAMATWSYL